MSLITGLILVAIGVIGIAYLIFLYKSTHKSGDRVVLILGILAGVSVVRMGVLRLLGKF